MDNKSLLSTIYDKQRITDTPFTLVASNFEHARTRIQHKLNPLKIAKEMDDDEGNLYADIEIQGNEIKLKKALEVNSNSMAENATLAAEAILLKEQLKVLVEEKAALERNMNVLFTTAQMELARKDKQIQELSDENSRNAIIIKKNSAQNWKDRPAVSVRELTNI